MVGYQLGEMTWYVHSARFLNERVATVVWERLQREAKKARGSWEVGFYRHGSSLENSVRNITVVGLHRPGVEQAAKLIGGEAVELDTITAQSLIMRRVRVMNELLEADAPAGSYSIRRGRRGGRLHPDGTIDERIGHG